MAGPPEPSTQWMDLIIKLAAVCGVVGGVCAAGWKWVRRAVTAARAADSLAGVFGHSAGTEIERLVSIILRSDGEQQLRQRVVESHLRIGVFECDIEGKCVWCNPYLAELFGHDESDMRGYGWLSAIVPDERGATHQRWRDSVDKSIPYDDSYTVKNRRTGRQFLCSTRAELIETEDGQPVCFIGWVIEQKP